MERSLIVQRWLASTGVERDVIVGVRIPSAAPTADEAAAHAWVDGWDADCTDRYAEIRRVPARTSEVPGARDR